MPLFYQGLLVGLFFGGFIGVAALALVSINRDDRSAGMNRRG